MRTSQKIREVERMSEERSGEGVERTSLGIGILLNMEQLQVTHTTMMVGDSWGWLQNR